MEDFLRSYLNPGLQLNIFFFLSKGMKEKPLKEYLNQLKAKLNK